MEWTCPNCNSRNPGPEKTCQNCGAPQPENVKFTLSEDAAFVKDEAEIKAAAAGADIHCAYCGTRNPATATTCKQCGADLKEGKARASGQEVKAQAARKSVKCPNCGAENISGEMMCKQCGAALPGAEPVSFGAPMGAPVTGTGPQVQPRKKLNMLLLMGGILGGLLVCCLAIYLIFLRPSATLTGTVTDVYWQTSISVQEIQPVSYSNERGSPPSDAYNVSCRDETQTICEQKEIDRGNGYVEVVEECHDETDTYCSYTVDEWKTLETFTEVGNDFSPYYASPSLTSDQRLGNEQIDFTVTFSSEKGQISYAPGSLEEFQQYQIGSQWTLKLNALGRVIGVEP
jgi:predicted RNA-binding Zn-ribbon protein involved in translation (DUF1610 family)